MKKNLFIVGTTLLAAAVLLLTPFVNGGLSTSSSDGYWRVCKITPDPTSGGGCYFVTFLLPALTPEEKAFKEKLDQIAPPPAKVSKDDIVKLMGKEPDQTIGSGPHNGRYQWNNFGPGSDVQRGVIVYLFEGQFNQVMWIQPNRFLLYLGYHPR